MGDVAQGAAFALRDLAECIPQVAAKAAVGMVDPDDFDESVMHRRVRSPIVGPFHKATLRLNLYQKGV